MESTLIWSITGFIMALIIFPAVIKFRRHVRQSASEKAEAKKLGIEKPLAQHPIIDVSRCIGCASCVSACPEGGVLGIVDGYAQIVNGLRCIGHGECEKACPVEGIYMGLGDLHLRDDIPTLDDNRQTNIPGIYIIGELGGLALIRNAIKQGIEVVRYIAPRIVAPSDQEDVRDICIVGAGPAGLSAALTAKEQGLSFYLIDQQGAGGTILQYPKKKLVLTQPVDLPLYGRLKKDAYRKEDLLAIWENIIRTYDIQLQSGQVLKQIQKQGDHFDVSTSTHRFKARKVILALGRRGTPRKLGVPGEQRSKVAYKLIDAQAYKDNHILVVGGGDSAIEAAMGLAAQKGNVVTLSYRKASFYRIKKRNERKLNSVLKRGKIRVLFNSTVANIQDDHVIIDLQVENGANHQETLKNDFVFIFAGGIPPYKLMKDLGISFGKTQVDPAETSRTKQVLQI